MVNLKGQKILFIGIGFYDYDEAIKNALAQQGAELSYINSSKRLFSLRIANLLGLDKIAKRVRSKYILNKINNSNNNDIVFVVKGENLDDTELKTLRKNNPRAKFILYLWDSLIRLSNTKLLFENFERILSFDRIDCENIPNIKFRPLFYRSLVISKSKKYDLFFVGWMHSDRLELLRKFKNQLIADEKSYYMKLYMGSFQYFIQRYITHILKAGDEDLIITKPLNYHKIQQIVAQSTMVLDIAHKLQSGLTMRTIETFASGCHLLTTNHDIINYDDISSSMYSIFDRTNPVIPNIDRKSQLGLSKNYSLDSFIDQIFA